MKAVRDIVLAGAILEVTFPLVAVLKLRIENEIYEEAVVDIPERAFVGGGSGYFLHIYPRVRPVLQGQSFDVVLLFPQDVTVSKDGYLTISMVESASSALSLDRGGVDADHGLDARRPHKFVSQVTLKQVQTCLCGLPQDSFAHI